jgi:hypothetical protein
VLAVAGCGDDSSSPDDENEPSRVSVSLDGGVSNVGLTSGQTTNHVTTFYAPSDFQTIESAEIDVRATMENAQLDNLSVRTLARALSVQLRGGEPLSAVTYLRVGTDPSTVCTEGILYGPFSAVYGTSLVVDPPTATADAATLQILNAGPVVVCLSITPDFDATLSLGNLEANVTQADCGSPANFEGRWVGTYDCGNSCTGEPFGGEVDLIVSQDGTSATYTDGGGDGDTYTGSICGNVFRFRRVNPSGDDEVGTLTLNDENHATKRSTWRITSFPFCGGDCVDQLTRTR